MFLQTLLFGPVPDPMVSIPIRWFKPQRVRSRPGLIHWFETQPVWQIESFVAGSMFFVWGSGGETAQVTRSKSNSGSQAPTVVIPPLLPDQPKQRNTPLVDWHNGGFDPCGCVNSPSLPKFKVPGFGSPSRSAKPDKEPNAHHCGTKQQTRDSRRGARNRGWEERRGCI